MSYKKWLSSPFLIWRRTILRLKQNKNKSNRDLLQEKNKKWSRHRVVICNFCIFFKVIQSQCMLLKLAIFRYGPLLVLQHFHDYSPCLLARCENSPAPPLPWSTTAGHRWPWVWLGRRTCRRTTTIEQCNSKISRWIEMNLRRMKHQYTVLYMLVWYITTYGAWTHMVS